MYYFAIIKHHQPFLCIRFKIHIWKMNLNDLNLSWGIEPLHNFFHESLLGVSLSMCVIRPQCEVGVVQAGVTILIINHIAALRYQCQGIYRAIIITILGENQLYEYEGQAHTHTSNWLVTQQLNKIYFQTMAFEFHQCVVFFLFQELYSHLRSS